MDSDLLVPSCQLSFYIPVFIVSFDGLQKLFVIFILFMDLWIGLPSAFEYHLPYVSEY